MRYTRLYPDDAGESHFDDLEESMTPTEFAPPAPPIDLSEFKDARRFGFLRVPAGWYGEPHVAPARQFVVVVNGTFEVTASDGEARQFGRGDVLLLEDTTGKGHATRALGESDAACAVVQL